MKHIDRVFRLLERRDEAVLTREIPLALGISSSACHRALRQLEQEGKVASEGMGRSRRWRVAAAPATPPSPVPHREPAGIKPEQLRSFCEGCLTSYDYTPARESYRFCPACLHGRFEPLEGLDEKLEDRDAEVRGLTDSLETAEGEAEELKKERDEALTRLAEIEYENLGDVNAAKANGWADLSDNGAVFLAAVLGALEDAGADINAAAEEAGLVWVCPKSGCGWRNAAGDDNCESCLSPRLQVAAGNQGGPT